MTVFNTKKEVETLVTSHKATKKTIGFVPTMGALHKGHLSLIQNAFDENDIVFVSIFVNPTQFDNNADLDKYPRTLDADVKLIESISDDIIVFAPSANEIYEQEITSKEYKFDGLEFEMEGKHRKGHFNGVGTILEILFKLVLPNKAYFGEKDFQQLQIVKKLTQKLKLDLDIVGCDIYREDSGLAMSSRNERLSLLARKEAAFIHKTLLAAKEKFGTKSAKEVTEWVTKQFAKNKKFNLEYVEIANIDTLKTVKRKSKNKKYRIFIAAFIENIRLIDNIALN
ncbi:pantoate--beta-alanine ligase [Pseudofulvibacter geojedonensis]|uniref:Pantothenate synthetase n=1 Tax=Pseudofulvibacter geojedonensis TaxID=1123758 RepID=A0ABW3I4Z6_9FLAO